MSPSDGDRSRHFPAIEKKHGRPTSHWLGLLARAKASTYPDQMALLQEKHGFGRTHANALVMTHRGSATSKRHDDWGSWLGGLGPEQQRAATRALTDLAKGFPRAERVIAWNQPMLRMDGSYLIGISAARGHLSFNPCSTEVLGSFADELGKRGYRVTRHIFTVPLDQDVHLPLVRRMVRARLAETRG